MRIITTIPQHNLRAVFPAATAIEHAGYDGIMTLENRHDPFLPLAVAATCTNRVELSTGIAVSFLRSPMSTANLTWDLNEASGGRFVLGLGTQIRAHNEKRFSVPWSAPAPRMREYIQALRAIWRTWKYDEPLRFVGKHYQFTLMIPNFVPEKSGLKLPAVTLAAVGPAMLNLSAEVADGVRLHPFCTRKYLDDVVLPHLTASLSKAGRKREHFEIGGGGFIATGSDDEAVAKAVEWVRYRIAFYGSTPAYWPVLEAHDLGDLGRKLNQMTKAGQWDKISAEISDDLVHLFVAIGRHDEIAGEIEKRFGGASDTIYASTSSEIQSELPADLISDIQAIGSSFKAYDTETRRSETQ
ncbi:MAG: TIGR03617 family F420-dependent LLM class oxidoreductase [Proteobacteria bacterium]|nr:TIGR03617 family F420-dependent LLM class oxidoreductase [Pseudomonadota bacterium]